MKLHEIIPFPKSKCKYCRRPIFNLNTDFGKEGMCIYCWEAEERGRNGE